MICQNFIMEMTSSLRREISSTECQGISKIRPIFSLVVGNFSHLGLFVLILLPGVERTFSQDPVPSQIFPQGTVVTTNSFESVEMEKLRLAREVGKLSKDDADFQESMAKIQKKLLESSALAFLPVSVPSELRAFLNAPSREIDAAIDYYQGLMEVLNELSPSSPYNAGTSASKINPRAAADHLALLTRMPEDEGIGQTILNQWAAKVGGARDDARRVQEIRQSIYQLNKERKRLEWNYRMTYRVDPLTGQRSGTEAEREHIQEDIETVKARIAELENEQRSRVTLATLPLRKLEFQQFIVQLALQQRYLHALIACGFYRNVFPGGDMSIQQDAFPASEKPEESKSATADSDNPPKTQDSNEMLSGISTITGLESFLMNRIRDAKVDREAFGNMVRRGQLGAAESLLGKLVLTARYQPELQTIPADQRREVANFSRCIRALSEAVNGKDYPTIKAEAEALDKMSSDIGARDIVAFAEENEKKALFWVEQADVALRAGDSRAASILLETAQRRSPHDKKLEESIAEIQESGRKGLHLLYELDRLIEGRKYAEAAGRLAEFMPLVSQKGEEERREAFESLIEDEKTVQAALVRSKTLASAGAYPEAWIAVATMESPYADDPRVIGAKAEVGAHCGEFVSAMQQAATFDERGEKAIALAWLLEAGEQAPASAELKLQIDAAGRALLARHVSEK
jgi:hypothetical protein